MSLFIHGCALTPTRISLESFVLRSCLASEVLHSVPLSVRGQRAGSVAYIFIEGLLKALLCSTQKWPVSQSNDGTVIIPL